ncbi:MAG: hypothetical protein QM532_03060, partial [Cyanobium sp. MAG06]|nr:hypothetical protein [Cyanobium sp. MAG06]
KQYKKEIIIAVITFIIGVSFGYLLSNILINKSKNNRSIAISNQEISDGYVKDDSSPNVKKSRTGICHDQSSAFYSKTKTFIPFNSIEECKDSGGRIPKERNM